MAAIAARDVTAWRRPRRRRSRAERRKRHHISSVISAEPTPRQMPAEAPAVARSIVKVCANNAELRKVFVASKGIEQRKKAGRGLSPRSGARPLRRRVFTPKECGGLLDDAATLLHFRGRVRQQSRYTWRVFLDLPQ